MSSLQLLSLAVGAVLLSAVLLSCAGSRTRSAHNEHVTSPNTNKKDDRNNPNIVILFADNLGYNDIGCFGSPTARTPNIDRLAREGRKLLHWNSAAHLCSASRAALLTGKYPAKMGIYPRVFRPDAVFGLLPEETTLAERLKLEGYATSIVGKWHLGHRVDYLPTNQGFDEWTGVPYHMSGGSVDNHVCWADVNETMWLPLYRDSQILQQPVDLQMLAHHEAERAKSFLQRQVTAGRPFFLYMAFSHVHQLCAPKTRPASETCQWSSSNTTNATSSFTDAVEEMDWIAGEVLQELNNLDVTNDTLVLFTSDNGPWVAEQICSGSKGPFEGRWLADHVDPACTACPSDYIPSPTTVNPRRCVLPGTKLETTGVHCGSDTGLGSVWEANVRMPALVRWPGKVVPGSTGSDLISTLDVVPTILSILETDIPGDIDGKDVSGAWFGNNDNSVNNQHDSQDRLLFFWRDGFAEGPLPPPYGRFDVAAVKMGNIKAHIWTKSAHYNDDVEVHHDPPLLFDVWADPAEAFPLDPKHYEETISFISKAIQEHKETIPDNFPLALATDEAFIPCVDSATNCKTVVDKTTALG